MDHKAEAEAVARQMDSRVADTCLPSMTNADVIALGQLHAALHLAERIDLLAKTVTAGGAW